jgi:hypothetical protein
MDVPGAPRATDAPIMENSAVTSSGSVEHIETDASSANASG